MSSSFSGFAPSTGFNFFNSQQNNSNTTSTNNNKDRQVFNSNVGNNDANQNMRNKPSFNRNTRKPFNNDNDYSGGASSANRKPFGQQKSQDTTSNNSSFFQGKQVRKFNKFNNNNNTDKHNSDTSSSSFQSYKNKRDTSSKPNYRQNKQQGDEQSFHKKNFNNNNIPKTKYTNINTQDDNKKDLNKNYNLSGEKNKNKNKNKNQLIINSLSKDKECILGPLVVDPTKFGFQQKQTHVPGNLPKFLLREKPQLVQKAFEQDAWDKANQEKMLKIEETGSNDTQDLYDLFRKMRVMERKMMENKNLVDKAEESKDLSEAISFQGTCLDMCPIFERARRSVENNVSNVEKDNGKINRFKALKSFARPAASAPPSLPSDVRPPHVLVQTLDYVIENLIGNLPEGESFLWDRMRSIRQDFTYQNYCGPETVDCNERICRIHLLILHIMAKSEIEYSKQQEIEQLTKSLITLCEIYDAAKTSSITYPNEPEFRAYWLLHNLRDPECDYVIQNLEKHIIEDELVQTVLTFRRIISNSNFRERGHISTPNGLNLYKSFFQLLSSPKTSFLVASFLENYVNEVRFYGFWQLKASTNKKMKPIPFETLMETFLFNNHQELIDFCTYYSIHIIDNNHVSIQTLEHTNHLIPEKSPLKQAWLKCVDEKLQSCGNYQNVINSGKNNFGIQTSKVENNKNMNSLHNQNLDHGFSLTNNSQFHLDSTESSFKPTAFQTSHSQIATQITQPKSTSNETERSEISNQSNKPAFTSAFSKPEKAFQFKTPIADVEPQKLDNLFNGNNMRPSTTPTPMATAAAAAAAKGADTSFKFNSPKSNNIKFLQDNKSNILGFENKVTSSNEDINFSIGHTSKTPTYSGSNNSAVENPNLRKGLFKEELQEKEEQKHGELINKFASSVSVPQNFEKSNLDATLRTDIEKRKDRATEEIGNKLINDICREEIATIVANNLERYKIREQKLNSIAEELYTAFIHERLYLMYLETKADLRKTHSLKLITLKQWVTKWKRSVEDKKKIQMLKQDISNAEKNIGIVKKRNISMDYYLNHQPKLVSAGLAGKYQYLMTPNKVEKREYFPNFHNPKDILSSSLPFSVEKFESCDKVAIDLQKMYFEPLYKNKKNIMEICDLRKLEVDIKIFSEHWNNTPSKWLLKNFQDGKQFSHEDEIVLKVSKWDNTLVTASEAFENVQQNKVNDISGTNIQLLVFNTGITDDDIFDLENKLKRDGEMLISLLNSKKIRENNYKINVLLLYWDSVETKYSLNELFGFFQIEKVFKIFGDSLIKRVDFLKINNESSIRNLNFGLNEISNDFKFEFTKDYGLKHLKNLKQIQKNNEQFNFFKNKRLHNFSFIEKDTDKKLKKNKIDEKLMSMLNEEKIKYMNQKQNDKTKKNTFQYMKPYTQHSGISRNGLKRKVSVLNSEVGSPLDPYNLHANTSHDVIYEEREAEEEVIEDPSILSNTSFNTTTNSTTQNYTGPHVVNNIVKMDKPTRNMMRNLTFNYKNEKQIKGQSFQTTSHLPSFETPIAQHDLNINCHFNQFDSTPSTTLKTAKFEEKTPSTTIKNNNIDSSVIKIQANASSKGSKPLFSVETPASRITSIAHLINNSTSEANGLNSRMGDGSSGVNYNNTFDTTRVNKIRRNISLSSSSLPSSAIKNSSISELKKLVESVTKKLESQQ